MHPPGAQTDLEGRHPLRADVRQLDGGWEAQLARRVTEQRGSVHELLVVGA